MQTILKTMAARGVERVKGEFAIAEDGREILMARKTQKVD